MAVVLAVGIVLAIAGLVLLFNVLGAGDYVIRTVTSRYLGSLPPGFAASKRGFGVYALLVVAIGVVFLGVGIAASAAAIGAGLIVLGAVAFVILSVVAIRGEADTVRKSRKV